MRVLGVIPARLGSTRLPNKPLQLLAGEPLITRVIQRVMEHEVVQELVVATDSPMIAQVVERAGVLVFVEMKARRTNAFGGAPYAVDSRKQTRMIRLAAHYLAQHKLTNQSCRFDVLLCSDASAGPSAIEHIENAFDVPGHDLQW